MSLLRIAWRSIQQRALSSTLTGLSMALGVALVVAVLVISTVVQDAFTRNAQGYHLIVGAKGGALQLVLNTVFHLSQPIENMPFSYYREFTEGRHASMVRAAVPYCLGDNYQGYRVVGSTPELFDAFQYASGRRYEFAEGQNFKHENFFESVIGSYVARQTGLEVGDTFEPTHGITTEEEQGHKHDAFEIVGILAPTGTANDRALFVNMEGFYLLDKHAKPVEPSDEGGEDHEHADHASGEQADDEHGEHDESEEHPDHHKDEDADRGHGENHDADDHDEHAPHEDEDHDHAHDEHEHEHKHEHEWTPLPENRREVTAILLLLKNDLFGQSLYTSINEGSVAQAVYPAREVFNLFQVVVGPIRVLLLGLAVLTVLVAAIGVMVSIYNTMSDRRREIAVMRALGADRRTVMVVVLLESILLALLGGAAGVVLGHGLIAALNPIIVARAGIPVGFLQFDANELILIPSLIVLATLAGFLPALSAYRTDVDRALTANP